MKHAIIILSLFCTSVYSIAPEKVEVDRHKTDEQARFQNLLRYSETAYALATSQLGSFYDPMLNSLTNRIQDDQKVIQESIRDTARMRDLKVLQNAASISSDPVDQRDYLQKQMVLHERMLSVVQTSSSPVLKNMEARIEITLRNLRAHVRASTQAQEDSASLTGHTAD